MSAPTHPRDLETREDLERLVRAFYSRAFEDPIIGWIFTDVAHLDLEAHVPVITSFWETLVLGVPSYSGGAFAPHAELHRRVGLRGGHFDRWLALWYATVDELFAGPRAELTKATAYRLGTAFRGRLQGVPGPDAQEAPRPGGLLVTRHGPEER